MSSGCRCLVGVAALIAAVGCVPPAAHPDLLFVFAPAVAVPTCGAADGGALPAWCARATVFTEAYAASDTAAAERQAVLTGVLPARGGRTPAPPELALVLCGRGYASGAFSDAAALVAWWEQTPPPRFAVLEREALGEAELGLPARLGRGTAVAFAGLGPLDEAGGPLARQHWRRPLIVVWPEGLAPAAVRSSAELVSTRDLFATFSRLAGQHLSMTQTSLDLAAVVAEGRGRALAVAVSTAAASFDALVATDWLAVHGPDGRLVTCARTDAACAAPLPSHAPAARQAFSAWRAAFPAVRASPLGDAEREALEALGYLR